MADRFFAPVPFDEPVIELSPEESQHLAGALRKGAGDTVVLFDGCGHAAEGVVESVGKRRCTVRISRRLPVVGPQSPRIELASAVPKGERARWLVEKATELGADRWTPLQLTRSVVDPGDGKLDRLRQTVITACKQCGRDRLLDIDSTCTWAGWLADATTRGTLIVAHPAGRPATEVVPLIAPDSTAARQEHRPSGLPIDSSDLPTHSVAVAVGPEGGFTDEEIAAALAAGAELVNLGPHILRIETAALAALAWLRFALRPQ